MPTPLSLARMVDLSIGTPEVGAVNFRLLHQLLHVMIKKLDLTDFVADLDGEFPDAPPLGYKFDVPGVGKSTHSSLQEKVSRIERDLERANALPSNADIIQKVQHDKPLTDLWQYIQLTKRVDAHDLGIDKVYGLVQELIREMRDMKKAQDDLKNRVDKINLDSINEKLSSLDGKLRGLSDLEDKVKEIKDVKRQVDSMQEKMAAYPLAESLVTWPGLEDAINGVRGEFASYKPVAPASTASSLSTSASQTEQSSRTPNAALPANSVPRRGQGDSAQVQDQLSPSPSQSRSRSSASDGPSDDLVSLLTRLGTIDSRHASLSVRVDDLEEAMQQKANKDEVGTKLPDDLLDTIGNLKSRLDDFVKLRDKDSEAIKKAQHAILGLQAELDKLQKLTEYLNNENDDRKKQQEETGREVVRLDAVKVDKEYVDKEIDVKADRNMVDAKVNYSVFDSACSDLQKMISDLLGKLSAYEEAWKNAHGKLEEDVDGKLDRSEVDRLKSYIDKRLKELQSKMKQVQAQSPFCEDAAGLKRQLLPFNCLSCDKPVVVSNHATLPSFGNDIGFAPQRSTKPYTTFELDQIRQHAKSLLHADSFVGDYYSGPRPCGGSHTTTQPTKRLGRSAYNREVFREDEQGLPDSLPGPDVEIVGADGHVYKGRNESPVAIGRGQIEARLPTTLQDKASVDSKRPTTSPPSARPSSARPTSGRSRPQTSMGGRVRDSNDEADEDMQQQQQSFLLSSQPAVEVPPVSGS